jgi:divalent metal cation (Fe/Co/Zn/Cd) transporter
LIGAGLAFLGIFLGHAFHNPIFDPIASILIALVLTAVAFLLGRESGALLVGERTNRSRIERVRKIIESDPAAEGVGDLLTMQLGPEQVLLTANIRFQRGLNVQQLEAAIARIEDRIKREEPTIERMFIEADSLRQNPDASRAA